jgi:hypothetical protein
MKTVTVISTPVFRSRHCERSEAIQPVSKKAGLLRRLRSSQ